MIPPDDELLVIPCVPGRGLVRLSVDDFPGADVADEQIHLTLVETRQARPGILDERPDAGTCFRLSVVSARQLVLPLCVPSDVRRESVWPSYCQVVLRKETHGCKVFKSNS